MMEAATPQPAEAAATPAGARCVSTLTGLLLEAIKDLCQAESASILSMQPDGSLAFTLACGGAADDLVGTRLDPEASVAGRVLKTLLPEIVTVPSEASRQIEAEHGYQTRSMLVVPLVDQLGRLFGVTEAVNSLNGSFSAHQLEALVSISTPLADAMRAIQGIDDDPEAISSFYAAVVDVMHARGAGLKDQNEHLHDTRRAFELDRARRYSDEKMASLARLACGVAHEINNPLSAVQSGVATATELSRDLRSVFQPGRKRSRRETAAEIEHLLTDLEEIANDARESLARIARIVHRLAAFGEIEPARLEEVNLAEEAHRMVDLLRMHADTGEQLRIDVDAPDLPPVIGCRTRIRQILVEVLDNATRAARAGEADPHVAVTVFSDQARIHVTVADNGPGIPDASQGQVFDPFFTTKADWRATGLGLTAAYGLVRALAGSIAVESAVGQGTTVTITLPRSTEALPRPADARARTGRYYEDIR